MPVPNNRKRRQQAVDAAKKKGAKPLSPREIEELYAAEPRPPLTGSPLERRIQRRIVTPRANR